MREKEGDGGCVPAPPTPPHSVCGGVKAEKGGASPTVKRLLRAGGARPAVILRGAGAGGTIKPSRGLSCEGWIWLLPSEGGFCPVLPCPEPLRAVGVGSVPPPAGSGRPGGRREPCPQEACHPPHGTRRESTASPRPCGSLPRAGKPRRDPAWVRYGSGQGLALPCGGPPKKQAPDSSPSFLPSHSSLLDKAARRCGARDTPTHPLPFPRPSDPSVEGSGVPAPVPAGLPSTGGGRIHSARS